MFSKTSPKKLKAMNWVYIYIYKKNINKVYIYCCNLLVKQIMFGIGYHALSAMHSTVNNFGSLHCVAEGKRSWRKKISLHSRDKKRFFPGKAQFLYNFRMEWKGLES